VPQQVDVDSAGANGNEAHPKACRVVDDYDDLAERYDRDRLDNACGAFPSTAYRHESARRSNWRREFGPSGNADSAAALTLAIALDLSLKVLITETCQ